MFRSTALALVLTMLIVTPAHSGGTAIPDGFKSALAKSKSFELYSLDPGPTEEKGRNDFHGYKVLGKTEVKPADRAKLVAALKKGVDEHDGSAAGCFKPRHGIRVKRDGKTYDFVICFECVAVALYQDAKRVPGFGVSESPAGVFNQDLKAAKVKLPRQPDD